jgi:hypothetical protein
MKYRINYVHVIPAALVLLFLSFTGCTRPEKRGYEALVECCKKSCDPQKLQKESVILFKKYLTEKTIPMDELPSGLTNVCGEPPKSAVIATWGVSKPALMVSWGGSFANHGLIIGDETFEMPIVDNLSVAEWSKGVFFYRKTR